jgi:hypothetical protein
MTQRVELGLAAHSQDKSLVIGRAAKAFPKSCPCKAQTRRIPPHWLALAPLDLHLRPTPLDLRPTFSMKLCIPCNKSVYDIYRHQRRIHPADYCPPAVKGEQFYCEECKDWYAFGQWSKHYQVIHNGRMPRSGRPKSDDKNRRSAAEANKSILDEYRRQLLEKGNLDDENLQSSSDAESRSGRQRSGDDAEKESYASLFKRRRLAGAVDDARSDELEQFPQVNHAEVQVEDHATQIEREEAHCSTESTNVAINFLIVPLLLTTISLVQLKQIVEKTKLHPTQNGHNCVTGTQLGVSW